MNRTSWISTGLAALGFVDSIYLTWIKLTGSYTTCGPIGNCEAVNSSRFAEIAGVPIALIGAIGYLAIMILISLEVRFPDFKEGLLLGFFGFTLTGTIYSAYLTYVEIAILNAICPYCVISALIMVLLFVLSVKRLRELLATA